MEEMDMAVVLGALVSGGNVGRSRDEPNDGKLLGVDIEGVRDGGP